MTIPNLDFSPKFSLSPASVYTVNAKSVFVYLILVSRGEEMSRIDLYLAQILESVFAPIPKFLLCDASHDKRGNGIIQRAILVTIMCRLIMLKHCLAQ